MINYVYRSVFAPHFNGFIKMKAAMGFNTPKIEYIFKELDELYAPMPLTDPILTKAMIDRWRSSRLNDSQRTLYDKWSVISQFARYMCHCGFICHVPLMPRAKDKVFIPKIFSHEEIESFFKAADSLAVNHLQPMVSMFSMPALMRLLYATGMRIGEAVSLKNKDMNLDKKVIIVKKTKNQRQRIVPITSSLEGIINQYIKYRNSMPLPNVASPDAPFFISQSGNAINKGTAYNWFRKILRLAGIPFLGNNNGPRLHDLRHTFAVHSLMKQVKAGRNLYCLLPILSVFMGHKTLSGTEMYVRLTSEMYPELNLRIGEVSSYVFPSLEKIVYEE